MRLARWLVVILAFALGGFSGCLVHRSLPRPIAPAEPGPAAGPAARPSPRASARPSGARAESRCAAERMDLAECERELQSARQRRELMRAPELSAPNEQPEAWMALMEGIFEDCRLPFDLEILDCEEPPCGALLRPHKSPVLKALLERTIGWIVEEEGDDTNLEEDLETALEVAPDLLPLAFGLERLCPAYKEAFSGYPTFAFGRVDCGGGRSQIAYGIITADEGDWDQSGAGGTPNYARWSETHHWIERKKERLLAQWECSDE